MITLHYLDANCLVKLVVTESDSSALRNYFFGNGVVCATTTFCFHEALSVLKSKWINRNRPDSISEETYLAACQDLCASVEDQNIQLEEILIADRKTFDESERLVQAHKIDMSDALQLVTLKRGMFSRLDAGNPVLITEDKGILEAARKEKLRAGSIRDVVHGYNKKIQRATNHARPTHW